MTIGYRIKQLRTKQKLSLRKLAKVAGVSTSYLSHIETEKATNPSMEILCRLSIELKTTLNYLCHGETEIELEEFEDLPESIQEFVDRDKERYGLQNEDILNLIGMKYRGNQPKTPDGWEYIFNSIKLVIEKGL